MGMATASTTGARMHAARAAALVTLVILVFVLETTWRWDAMLIPMGLLIGLPLPRREMTGTDWFFAAAGGLLIIVGAIGLVL